MSGQRLHCDVCGWECRAEKGMTLEDAHDCKGPPSSWPVRAPHPPQGDSAVAAALHASQNPDQTAPQEVYSEAHGYSPEDRVPDSVVLSLASLDAHRPTVLVDELYNHAILLAREVARLRGIALCGAETTLRNDEHRLAQCFEPKGHLGVHRDPRPPAPVEWTDETTRFAP